MSVVCLVTAPTLHSLRYLIQKAVIRGRALVCMCESRGMWRRITMGDQHTARAGEGYFPWLSD